MDRDPWGLETLTRRIAVVAPGDPCSPAHETSAELTRIHRELSQAVGPEEARARFDRALRDAVTSTLASRPASVTPAA